jgi:uncharacterized Ntn-hydrolase superfamily protein
MRASMRKATFSIVAADPVAREVGCAVQSKYFAVGNVVPWARADVGAVATQAAGIAVYGPRALDALAQGLTSEEAIAQVLEHDEGRETRQLGVVTADGRAAVHTGAACLAWAGHRVGDGYSVQGNILAGEDVVDAMEHAFIDTDGTLAERLVAALEAGQAAGGDARGQQSAAVVVERSGAAAEGREGLDRVCDLRVDDHAAPIAELRRLIGIHVVWDALRHATAFHAPGRFAEGAALLSATLERHGEDAALLYDLACFECMAGDAGAAVEHIRRAIEIDDGLRAAAAADPDLAALADDAGFRDLVGPGAEA